MATLLISMDFPPHKDGITTLAKELAEHLSLDHEDTFIVIGPSAKNDFKYDQTHKFKIYRSPLYDYGYIKLIPLLFIVPYVVIKHKINKIIATNVGYGGFIAVLLKTFLKLDYIVTAQGYEFMKFKDNVLVRKIYSHVYRNAHAIVTCSQYVKKLLLEFGAKNNKIIVVYPGVDTSFFKPLKVPDAFLNKYSLKNRKILLSVSRLVHRKGHDMVLDALPTVAQKIPEILYIIVGKGPEKNRLEKIIKNKKLDPYVLFTDEISNSDLQFFYNCSNVFIMPSREVDSDGHVEGFGIVFIEANACGKPVIGGRSGGIPEAIVNGKTGFLVDPENSADIADKITNLLCNNDLSSEMGQFALQYVKEHFSWNDYTNEFKKLLSEMK
ncbi:MAG: glycosyltransferase family 4 protein [Candidatus Ancaeobacter aquaticus]|nr:glycosyltransferase family 4 protein [Candidatus Ancaeobacter aquaticus]